MIAALSLAACTVGKDGKDGAQGVAGVPCQGCVTAESLAPGAVTGTALQDGSVGTPAFAAKSVTGAILADGAVTGPAIAANAISGTGPVSVSNTLAGPVVGMAQASASSDGYISAADFSAFSNKQNLVSGTCVVGQSVQAINADGTVICGPAANFKSITNNNFMSTGAGVTNILRLDITVPTSGLFLATASGYCNISTGTTNARWDYVIGTSAGEGWSFPIPLVQFPAGVTVSQFPITAVRTIPAHAGVNSLFLNMENFIGTALANCQGTLTAFFTPAELP